MKQVDLEEYGFWFKIRILGLQNTDFEFSNLACLYKKWLLPECKGRSVAGGASQPVGHPKVH